MSSSLRSAEVLLGELASLARLVYARDLDLPILREAVMQAYDAAQAHLAELEECELDAWEKSTHE